MRNLTVLGIDLAKDVFQVHGADANGKEVLSRRLTRAQLTQFMINTKPCLVGMEACGGAHHWARLFRGYGHTVKLMAPQFVKPYIKSNKNDRNDARGIAEAVTRPDMKFVPIKNVAQQAVLLLHRVRELAIKRRTAQANQIRGLLSEFGVIIPKGIRHLHKLPTVLDANKNSIPGAAMHIFTKLHEGFLTYDKEVDEYEAEIKRDAKNSTICKNIMEIEGVGPITASAITATIGDAKAFKNGREVAAWLGLVPKQRSSGNKIQLLGISKRGDQYVRKLLVHGARAAIKVAAEKKDRRSIWITSKKDQRGYNKASVALANKNARIIWAIMATGECYRKPSTEQRQAA